MKVSSLQLMDRYIGVPVCFTLTLLRKIFPSRTRSTVSTRRWLFVKLAEQGSTVLAYSALRKAVETVGRENVYFICFEENRFILDAMGILPEGNVVIITHSSPMRLLISAIKAIARLRSLELEAAIDMEFFARGSAALAFLAGARERVGFHAFFGAGAYRGDLMTHRLIYNPYLHTEQVFESMVEALNYNAERFPTLPLVMAPRETVLPRFVASPEEIQQVRDVVAAKIGRTVIPPLILLNPNASDLLAFRRWETSRYVQLAKQLLETFPDVFIIFTGGRAETDANEALAREVDSERCVSLAGQTTLRQLLILYSLSNVLVTNDSGPAHFAALTSIQVVTLFGPETPKLFGSRTPRHTAIWAGLACSPCVNAYNNRQTACTNNLCMQRISVEEVFAQVCQAYKRSRFKTSEVVV